MATGYCYGHPVYYDYEREAWCFQDNNEPATEGAIQKRLCPKCGRPPTPEGYDACLGHIPGAVSACCGHGVYEGHVMWEGE